MKTPTLAAPCAAPSAGNLVSTPAPADMLIPSARAARFAASRSRPESPAHDGQPDDRDEPSAVSLAYRCEGDDLPAPDTAADLA